MSENYKQRSILEIMNDVLGTIRDYYDSEYVYYIERDEEEILTIYEWCAEFVPWQRDKIKMLDKEQWPRWIRQDITDTTEADYSVSQPLEDGITAVLAAVGVHRGGYCSSAFRTRMDNGIIYHVCRTHNADYEKCPNLQIPEYTIQIAFLHLYHKLRRQGLPILNQLLADLQVARKGKLLWSLDIVALNQKIADITRQDRLLAQLKQQGLVDPDIFISRRNELAEQLRAAKLEKERFLEAEEDQTLQQTQELIEALEAGPDFLDAFDGELFRELVDKIIVESNDRLRFRLVNGLELTEPIERTVR